MLRGVRCVFGNVSMEEHQRCMVERAGPPCGIEPSILQLITRPNLERQKESVVFSPSSLSGCHRQAVLSKEHDWYIDVRHGYKMIRGTIIHEGMGREPAYPGVLGVVREVRMGAPINTRFGQQTFKGKPDLVVLLGVDAVEGKNVLRIKIVDYKTRTEIGHDLVRADERYVNQVNAYGWLAAQFLPEYLNTFSGAGWGRAREAYEDHLFLNEGVSLPYIDAVVVEEISITYLDMSKTRTFTSSGFLYDRGKMLSDKVNGRWVRRRPVEYEELELEPLSLFKPQQTEEMIRAGIERQIEARTTLAEPLVGDDAKLMCRNCPVRQACYEIGRKQGYEMADQALFVEKPNEEVDA